MKAVQAIHQAPGVLAVDVDYKSGIAVIGTQQDRPVARDKILEAIQGIGYKGEFVGKNEQPN